MPISTDPAAATGSPNEHIILPFARRTGPDAAAAGDEPRRPAKVLAFPAPPADRCRLMAGLAKAVADRLDAGHVELLEAAAELLALDDISFAARTRSMMDDDAGRALMSDLLGTIQVASTDFDRGQRSLFVLRARLTAGIAAGGARD